MTALALGLLIFGGVLLWSAYVGRSPAELIRPHLGTAGP